MEATISGFGFRVVVMAKKKEAVIVYWGFIGIMERQRGAIIVYWGNVGIMDEKT